MIERGITGNDFEPDGFDETWCLYDSELIDDELYTALGSFAAALLLISSPKRYSMQDIGKRFKFQELTKHVADRIAVYYQQTPHLVGPKTLRRAFVPWRVSRSSVPARGKNGRGEK